MSDPSPNGPVGDLRLIGERCQLRPLVEGDAPRAFAMIHDRREILDWLVWQGPRTIEDLVDHCRHWRIESDVGASYQLAIALAESDLVCGSLSLRPAADRGAAELGYWIGVEHWGKGIGKEAVLLACHLGLRLLELSRLRAEVFDGNARSMRLLESLGFERGDRGHPFACPDGRVVLEWTYELTREVFASRHGAWQPVAERAGAKGTTSRGGASLHW